MKKFEANFKKNFPTGVTTLLILGIFVILLEFVVGQIKSMWNALYHLLPWQIKNPTLEFVVFIVSTLTIVWFVGSIVNLEYKGRRIADLSNVILSHIPIINHVFKFFYGIKKSVTGFLKYKTVVYWEAPVINTIIYGIITNRVKIVKKIGRKNIEQFRFTVYVPTVPAILTGNLFEPDPKHLWLITNLSLTQLVRLVATAGADKPEIIESIPLLKQYPNCQIDFKEPK